MNGNAKREPQMHRSVTAIASMGSDNSYIIPRGYLVLHCAHPVCEIDHVLTLTFSGTRKSVVAVQLSVDTR